MLYECFSWMCVYGPWVCSSMGADENITSPAMVVTVVVSHHVLGASTKPASALSH